MKTFFGLEIDKKSVILFVFFVALAFVINLSTTTVYAYEPITTCVNNEPSNGAPKVHPLATINVNVIAASGRSDQLGVILKNSNGEKIREVKTCGELGSPGTSVTLKTAFYDVDAGSYSVCADNKCSDIEVSDGALGGGTVDIGLVASQDIQVLVKLHIPTLTEETKYGPIEVSIVDHDGKFLSSATTNSKVMDAGLPAQALALETKFTGASPGNLYQACIDLGTSSPKCSAPVVYVLDSSPTLTIEFDETESAKFVYTPNPSADTPTCGSVITTGMGWIVCPVMNFLGDIADGSFDVITHLLSIRSELVASGDSSGTYVAWQYFRDISNVLFVIAFLVIIFSQLTGVGVNNYGVKKILPRLVITAILVNLSFYLCQIAVDISEILGHSLNSFIGETIPKQLSLPQSPPTWTENLGKVLAGVAISAAATGLAIAGYLAISVPVLLAALLSLVVTLAILVGRQAAVVILIVISPLAFVAYLLPNTEQWFKKWGNMLVGLLLVYPAISLLYGAGKLAGLIIHSANPGDVLMNIVALGATAIPLIATPSLLKGSMNATGTIGAKLSGWASKANNAVGARVKDSSSLGEIGNYRAQQRQIRRAEGRAKTTGVRGVLNRVPNALGGMGYADHMARRGSALADQEFEQSVSDSMAAQKTMTTEGKDDVDGLMQVATGKSLTGAVYSEADRVAAIRTIMKTGSLGQREKIYATSSESGVSNAAKAAMREGYFARGDHQAFGADLGDQFTLGKVDASALEAGLSEQLTKGKISAATLASDKDVAERVRDIVNGLDDTTKAKVAAQASIAMSSPGTSEKLTSAHRDILSEISGNGRKGGLVDQHGNPL